MTHDHDDYDYDYADDDVDDYVNEDCPALCSESHDAPEWGFSRFTCPTTGERFYWCEYCHAWNDDSPGHENVQLPDGDYICWDCFDECYCSCEECGTYVRLEDTDYDEYREGYFCPDCQGGAQIPPTPVTVCGTCGTEDMHLHALSEAFLCDHEAREAIDRGEPVLLYHPLPTLTVAMAA